MWNRSSSYECYIGIKMNTNSDNVLCEVEHLNIYNNYIGVTKILLLYL